MDLVLWKPPSDLTEQASSTCTPSQPTEPPGAAAVQTVQPITDPASTPENGINSSQLTNNHIPLMQ